MATTTQQTTGAPRKVGSYADRTIIAQRVEGAVQLRDEPAGGEGRSFLIEPDVSVMAELKAIVADYTATADRIEDVPMKRSWF